MLCSRPTFCILSNPALMTPLVHERTVAFGTAGGMMHLLHYGDSFRPFNREERSLAWFNISGILLASSEYLALGGRLLR